LCFRETDTKYLYRDTLHGKLKKSVRLPVKVDFTKPPSTVMHANCLTIEFALKK
jgi:hypothetical protein